MPLFVIVGMGEGIGLAVARRFAKEGFALAMIARNAAKLEGFQKSLQAEGYKAYSFIADAGSEDALKSAFISIRAQLGDPEVLVYNAATLKMENILNETMESLANDFKVNIGGALTATQAVLSAMKAQGKGTILFTGGGFSMYPSPDFASLSLGKAGIKSLAKMLSDALKGNGIRVGTITVCGTVNSDDPKYNPDSIAENYWSFHAVKESGSEIVY